MYMMMSLEYMLEISKYLHNERILKVMKKNHIPKYSDSGFLAVLLLNSISGSLLSLDLPSLDLSDASALFGEDITVGLVLSF